MDYMDSEMDNWPCKHAGYVIIKIIIEKLFCCANIEIEKQELNKKFKKVEN